jgi:AraC family transcriptional regulator
MLAADLDRALLHRRRNGGRGGAVGKVLAKGDGWSVDDVICTSGPADRSFEERHSRVSIAIVAAGSFQYRSTNGRAMLTPGAILLGSVGRCFECGHEHGAGDRCIAFNFSPAFFERIAVDAGASDTAKGFAVPRLPSSQESADVVAQACAELVAGASDHWDEIAVRVAARAARLVSGQARPPERLSAASLARVTDVVREIERSPSGELGLDRLAAMAGLSPFHFLRTFGRVTGLTPRQYIRRARLRQAAVQLARTDARIIDVAYDSGFGDVSNFNHAFRAEFGANPRAFRRRSAGSRS